jgi:hypothetical protein
VAQPLASIDFLVMQQQQLSVDARLQHIQQQRHQHCKCCSIVLGPSQV